MTTVNNVTNNTKFNRKAEKKRGKRIGYNYIILESLKESKKNDVIKCLYIKSLTKFGICVIKEGTYGDTKDSSGRDIKDRLIWQKKLHEQLQNKVRVPRLLGSFEENGNYYLILEHIKGKSLYTIIGESNKELRQALKSGNKLWLRFLNYLLQIIDILQTLHRHHIVHRDITTNNIIIMPSGKVALIDMELSYSLQLEYPSPPFELGTYGYMSPEQRKAQKPTEMEDIFSLGAIMVHMWTGISPKKVTDEPPKETMHKVHFLIPDEELASIITQCLDPLAMNRPSLESIQSSIIKYKANFHEKKERQASNVITFNREQILDTCQQAIGTLISPILMDEKGWFSDNQNQPNGDKNHINKSWYASFNLGASGIIYLLSKAKKIGLNIEETKPYIARGIELVQERYITRIDNTSTSLHFGSHGIAASLSTAIKYGVLDINSQNTDWITKLLRRGENISLGIMHGISGQGLAHLICSSIITIPSSQEDLLFYVQHLIERQEKDGSWKRTSSNNEKRIASGFANGVAGISYFLLEYGERYLSKEAVESAQRGLRWLIKNANSVKNCFQWTSSIASELSPSWCDGPAGVALCFLKAYTFFKEPLFKRYAVGALNNYSRNIINNNLSQCHGLCGLGEIYIEAFQTLQDDTWLDRAAWISQLVMHLKKQDNSQSPYWLVENEYHPTASFMTGNSGVLHFLLRRCYPDTLRFPLIPISSITHNSVSL